MPVAAEDQHKTAFVTPFGLFQFKVLPFGLSGAPASFQRLMDRLINGYQDFSAAYLDDLVIFSSSWEEHLDHLRKVLKRLQEASFTAKPSKCQFAMEQCVYIGHIVGSGTIRPASIKLEAVHKFPVPETKKQVRTFLGLTGYYRRFIPEYSSIAAPLTDLTKKSSPNQVVWSAQCDEAFVRLKQLLCSSPILLSPDISKLSFCNGSSEGKKLLL